MGKIKLNLVSGAIVEKPLITAFKANNNSYVVLDNEINGSMGLPIILVCKFENDKLTKILDQNEWGIVKEYLKNIIAGNQIEFININSELSADDIYYTQLTLPVPSFDALKNAYKVETVDNTVNLDNTVTNVLTEETPNEVVNNTTVVEPVVSPVQEPISVEPVIEQSEPIVVNVEPVIDIPVNSQVINEPIMPNIPVVENVEPVISPMDIVPPVNPQVEMPAAPVIEPVVNQVVEPVVENEIQTKESIFSEQKEAFMQACENMFDALVQKFERELENNKKAE